MNMDIGLSGFARDVTRDAVRAGDHVPEAHPHIPTPAEVLAHMRRHRPPSPRSRAATAAAHQLPSWHDRELALVESLGVRPSVDDEVAFSRYAAEYSRALWRLPVYPPGVFGVMVWAAAEQSRAHAAAVSAAARRAPSTLAADAARAEAHAAEQAAIEAALEDKEWCAYEAQVDRSWREARMGEVTGVEEELWRGA